MSSLSDRLAALDKAVSEAPPNSKIAGVLWRKGVQKTSELDRILKLPRRTLDLATVPDLTPLYLHTEICSVKGCDLCRKGPAKLLPMQSACLLEAERLRGALGCLAVGRGKCLGRGTPVLLYDGRIVPVEKIMKDDLLMGPDSRPRRVLSTTSGTGPLYQVDPIKGDPWVCNDAHMLTIVQSVSGEVQDISVNDFLRKPRHWQKEAKLFQVAVDFSAAESLPLDPYFLGVWFGDGTKLLNGVSISKPDPEILQLCEDIARQYGLSVRTSISPMGCPTYHISDPRVEGRRCSNTLLTLLRSIVTQAAVVPRQYLTASRADREAFLAGWLDSDGFLTDSGYEILQKRRDYADAICFLARSLGIRVTIKSKEVPGYGTFWRMRLQGECTHLPLRIPRKKAPPRRQKKNALRTGFSLMPFGEGQFFGFELDGDGRFLLGDFTVTHNTLLSVLLFDALQSQRGVLLVPSDVRDQLIQVDIPRYGRHFRLPLDRFKVVSYQQLQTARTAGVLEEIDPDCVVADEGHMLRHKGTARWRRFNHCMKARPGIPFVPLSGTFTTRKVTEVGHLSEMALRKHSPYPSGYVELCEWGDAVDAKKDGEENMPPGALLGFCTGEELDAVAAGALSGTQAARQGLRRRLTETPGVIATQTDELGVSLVIRRRLVTVPEVVTKAVRELERTWSLGDEEIDSPATMAAVARQMACGFYYVWDWPGGIVDREWVEARRGWNRAVRTFLTHSARPGRDSPMLVATATMRGEIPSLRQAWDAWAAVRERPQPPTKPIWLSEFLIDDVAAWVKMSDPEEGCLVWYAHTALEAPLSRLMPVFGAGSSEPLVELAASPKRPAEHRVIALSVHAHRKGKNLQRWWSQNYYTTCMANGEAWEQSLGRTHRPGQESDEVTADVPLHMPAVRAAWEQAVADARYTEDSTASGPQKLNYASKVGF